LVTAGAAVASMPSIDRVFAQEPESTPSTEHGEVLKPSDRAILGDMSPDFDNQFDAKFIWRFICRGLRFGKY